MVVMWIRIVGPCLMAGLLAGALAACSSTLETLGDPMIAPGKFDFLKCPDIARRSVLASQHEKEVVSLMDRANQDAVGPMVNTMIYAPDLASVRAELELLRKTAAEKNCDNLVADVPPPNSSPQTQAKKPQR
jgi:hypothetical protein